MILRFIFLSFSLFLIGQHDLVHADACSTISTIYPQIESLRSLNFKQKVPCSEKNKAEVLTYLESAFEKQLPKEDLFYEEVVLKSLKLLPPDYDYKRNLLNMYNEQVAGYYDPYEKAYTIASWLPEFMHSSVAMHELTHVLQDQHYNLLDYVKPEMTTDQSLARAAVVEGDATFTMYELARKITTQNSILKISNIDPVIKAIENESAKSKSFSSSPEILRSLTLFPYTEGFRFIFNFLKTHSKAPLNDYFLTPPQHTSQILHPEEYYSEMNLHEFSCPKMSSSELLNEDSLGEYFYSLLMKRKGKNRGWNGDIVCIYGHKKYKKVEQIQFLSRWQDKKQFQEIADYASKIQGAKIDKSYPDLSIVIEIEEFKASAKKN